ncbi:MAG: glycoside hydrolase [Planctomycetes bacterium]|nr:glycoside hydrolase [Planctomycetota bacterium]
MKKRSNSIRPILVTSVFLLCSTARSYCDVAPNEKALRLTDFSDTALSFHSEIGESGEFTWWLPAGADEYVLPISAGVVVDTVRSDLMCWLRAGSPWSLLELPVLGARYSNQMAVIIVPWPHYAELIVTDRIGIRYSLPRGRHRAAPCEIVTMRRGTDPLEVARGFREWRQSATNTGKIPRARPLQKKIADMEKVTRLLGAPHFYLWGPALFSRHDIPRNKWVPFAKALLSAPPESFGGKLAKRFADDQRSALHELAAAEWPMDYLTVGLAGAINTALAGDGLLKLSREVPVAEVIRRNQQALADAFASFVNPPESWGDGLSNSLLDSLHEAGIERALLVLSDLYGRSPRPDVVAHAEKLGFLLGPYDEYHSVHSPSADPDSTWETSQFDVAAYEQGRVVNADGSGHVGFRGQGYHFSPQAAWPYMQERVNRILRQAPYSAWFIDCDATAECFDDFSPGHPATRIEDAKLRRQRLAWLESEHRLVVGSEGGSVLFADVIHFGHGVHTPYIGHLDPSFRDTQSPYYLGRYWPPDSPEQFFKPVPVPPSLKTPYFDPTVRIPLYQAALGDEVIATHHWNFDSLKFADIKQTRELMEILYVVPPMYHLNRETWPKRRDEILQHLAFWGPLHRELATAPLTRFACLSEDRLVQRTTFQPKSGEVTITVNFGAKAQAGFAPYSATATGSILMPQRVFRAEQRGP